MLFGCLLALLKCSDERVHVFDLGMSPDGVRGVDRDWCEGSPVLGQASRAGERSLPDPLISEPDPCTQVCKLFALLSGAGH